MANGGRRLRWFSQALRHYERSAQLKAEDRSGDWAKNVKACRELEARSSEAFKPDRQHQALTEFLFPELGALAKRDATWGFPDPHKTAMVSQHEIADPNLVTHR
jgi:hypothetical protein